MVLFSTIFLTLAVQHVVASDPFLRTYSRRLSQELFLSYEPITTVTDHAALDLDQAAMEAQLALGTDQGRQAALKVYTGGAFSKSYAALNLAEGLKVEVAKGTVVIGKTAAGNEVRGETTAAFKMGDTVLLVEYHAGTVQATWTDCHVGGNPEPNTRGCFAETGSLEIGNIGEHTYTYDPLLNNLNARTLQGFSTSAKEKMYECATCPYPTYLKYYSYYGAFDYANQWVLAAFNKGSTNFANGNAIFTNYGMDGTTEAIKKGTAYMNVWMYVIREMEDAVDDCSANCATDACNSDQVNAWDEAVAFYTGGVPKSSGQGGYFLYTLAQKRCENYGTCITTGAEVGMAAVNSEIYKNFRMGKQDLLMGNCAAVKTYVKRITELMAVPLIQGTIRYAYIMDKQNDTLEKSEAEGATFAAAVLPLLHACNAEDAAIVYNNMRVGNGGSASFKVVKSAFEKNYGCLGVTCADVGGLVDMVNKGYLPEAEPCDWHPAETEAPKDSGSSSSAGTTSSSASSTSSTATTSNDGPNVGLAVGLTVGIVAFLIIVALLVSRKKDQKEYDGAAEPEMT